MVSLSFLAFFPAWLPSQLLREAALAAAALLIGALCFFLSDRLIARRLAAWASRSRFKWDYTLARHGLFRRLAGLASMIVVRVLFLAWLPSNSSPLLFLLPITHIFLAIQALLTFFSAMDGLMDILAGKMIGRHMPIRGITQALKLVSLIVTGVVVVSLLLGKSPALLVSGLGAMTAVLMLVFKDPLLGFVAGIQLSANRMVSIGDWLEMPKYQADGDVMDITLTTVKVRNWDQTITTVPTYALISDSFKNWRGMQEAGGRRIMRSISLDMHSVRFLSAEDIARLRKAQLISGYIENKLAEIEQYNRDNNVDPSSPANGRRLTNVGTFRAYLSSYLKAHPGIHPDLIVMVRQLQPTAEGLPLQIYAFTRDTAWVVHEAVQSDIFDHILAVVPEFGLRVYQSPTGSDVRSLVLK